MIKEDYKVYKITHRPTNEQYVGITKNTIEGRFIQHMDKVINDKKIETKLDRFIEKHIDHREYDVDLLTSGYMTREEAERLEEDMITKYDTMNNGLNTSLGGTNSIYSYKFTDKLKEEYLSGHTVDRIAKENNITKRVTYGLLSRRCRIEHVRYQGLILPPYVMDPRFYIPNAPPYTFRY